MSHVDVVHRLGRIHIWGYNTEGTLYGKNLGRDLFSCLQYGTKIRLDGIDCEVRVCPNSGKALVYDSEEEEEGPSDENLTTDKKKVLKFFNEGTEQELTGIQVPYRTD